MSDLKPIQGLRPFTKFCCTIGNLPASYLAGMTYAEQLLWFCDYLQNTIIPTVNNNAEAVEELQNLYTELKSYVDNYFTNLDVQEEINNKLDEMAEDGELSNIINNYLQIAKIYNTITDLVNDETLINNSKVSVLGYYTINDGGKADYYITNNKDNTKWQIQLKNELYATLILENNFVNAEVFGIKANDTDFDNMTILNNVINNFLYNKQVTLLFKNTEYNFKSCIKIKQNFLVKGNNTIFNIADMNKSYFLDTIEDSTEKIFNLENIEIKINKKLVGTDTQFSEGAFIRLFCVKSGKIKNVTIKNNIIGNIMTCLWIRDNTENVDIKNCNFSNLAGQFIGGTLWIWNYAENGIIKNINIENCILENNTKDEILGVWGNGTQNHITVKNCIFNSSSSEKLVEISLRDNTNNINLLNNIFNYKGNIPSYIILDNATLINIDSNEFNFDYNYISQSKFLNMTNAQAKICNNTFKSLNNNTTYVYLFDNTNNILFSNNIVENCSNYLFRQSNKSSNCFNKIVNNYIKTLESFCNIVGNNNNINTNIIENNKIIADTNYNIINYTSSEKTQNKIINNFIKVTGTLNIITGLYNINLDLLNNLIEATIINLAIKRDDTGIIILIHSFIEGNSFIGTLNNTSLLSNATDRLFKNNTLNNTDLTIVSSSPESSEYSNIFQRLIPINQILISSESGVLGYKKINDNNGYTKISI